MYTNLLVPLDTSSTAEQVLPYLRHLASPQTTIHLVSVVEPHLYAYAMAAQERVVQEKLQAVIKNDMEQYLEQIQEHLQNQGYQVERWLAAGDAAQTIADVASKVNADLIAMTTHGRTGLARWALGSVADRVIHSAQQPIFLVRTNETPPLRYEIQQILVPLDGSQIAEEALADAKTLATETNAALSIVRVLEPLSDWQKEVLAEQGYQEAAIEQERRAEASSYLNTISAQLNAAHITTTCELFSGQASEAILHILNRVPIDLVVMSTHGLSGYSRWVYGSVAGKVLHSAPCPLLLRRSVALQAGRTHTA